MLIDILKVLYATQVVLADKKNNTELQQKMPLKTQEEAALWREIAPVSLKKIENREIVRRIDALKKEITSAPFWTIESENILYESGTGLLWGRPNADVLFQNGLKSLKDLLEVPNASLKGWRLPTREELFYFAQNPDNPLRTGINNRLVGNLYSFLTQTGVVYLDNNSLPNAFPGASGSVIPCNDTLRSPMFLLATAIGNKWQLINGKKNQLNTEAIYAMLFDEYDDPETTDPMKTEKPLEISFASYKDIDHRRCCLPELEPARFTDPNKGLWELWGQESAELANAGIRSRNPADDVKEHDEIAIDFGTSSTVVAHLKSGRAELLRVGTHDFYEKAKTEHYENPTALEFLHLAPMHEIWNRQAYRPDIRWKQVRCSHEARNNLRNNETNPAIVASVLEKIKQWSLRDEKADPLRITDQMANQEYVLPLLVPRNPVKGQSLQVDENDPLDPLELYAWFLGMTINWRDRGIFLKYALSFPVSYPKEVKENILASFRRGLQRSLPETLIKQTEIFSKFEVEERASEPAAYAAAAMPVLGIAPTPEGTPYAVFDFGGGTTDFDFGLYRLPDAEEEERGYDEVFEHIGAGGDRYLGGENLLENLAYLVFQHNQDLCRKHKIILTRPVNALDFPGSEMLLEKTQAATTNTLMLMSSLRPLWENGAIKETSGVITIEFLTREGERAKVDLAIPLEVLHAHLEERIAEGVRNFYTNFKKAFSNKKPAQVHVLLAGNASRCMQIAKIFDLKPQEGRHWSKGNKETANKLSAHLSALFDGEPPEIICHPPLPQVAEDLYRPTAKTGVALGLLRLRRGGAIKVITHSDGSGSDQAPFAHYVGWVRRGCFIPGLSHSASYNEWCEVGIPRERVLELFHTTSPNAHTQQMRETDKGLTLKRIDITGECEKHRAYARPVTPNRIELCTATSLAALEKEERKNVQFVDL